MCIYIYLYMFKIHKYVPACTVTRGADSNKQFLLVKDINK